MEEIRIQKILSANGYGSRRDCEKFIDAGRIKVNGKKAKLGQKANPDKDRIEFDNREVTIKKQKNIYIAFYKPRRVLSDIKKIDDRMIITDYVKVNQYLFIVGRLDFESEGLILLTNNGDVANKLTHPRYEHEKEYYVKTARVPDRDQLNIWRRGVVINKGYRTRPATVEHLPKNSKNWLKIVMKEGKKRQIREIGLSIGLPIKKIIRKRIATLQVGELKPGEWRYLTRQEEKDLLSAIKS